MDTRIAPPGVKQGRVGDIQVIARPLYDTLLCQKSVSALASTEILFKTSRAEQGGFRLSNMEQSGRLSNDKEYDIYGMGIECYFENAALYPLFVYTTRVELSVGSTVAKFRSFVSQVPASGGLYGSVYNAASVVGEGNLSNGVPSVDNYMKFPKSDPIKIGANKNFQVALIFDEEIDGATGVNSPRALINADTGLKIIRAYLYGLEFGDVIDN